MQIDWGETKLLSGPLHFFFFLLSAWVGYPALWTSTRHHTKKKKRKINSWKKWNPDRILFTFKTQQKCQKTHFFFSQNESTNIKKQRAHMPFFWSKKVKAHSPTFILFVKLCKKPIKKKKNDISTVPPVRTLVLKNSTMTHSLHSFKSPDIILSATRRPKTKQQQKKLLHQR